jgi:hypothetical protein
MGAILWCHKKCQISKKCLCLTIPETLLAIADEVIQ